MNAHVASAAGSLVLMAAVFAAAADKPAADTVRAAEAQKVAQQKVLEKFDANKDGVLSDAEKVAAAHELKRSGLVPVPGSEEFVKRFDKNGDGKLNATEQLAAQSAWQKMRRGGGGGPVRGVGGGAGPLLPIAGGGLNDAGNADGEAEKKKVKPLIKLYDKDGDGKLNEEEKAALQADRRKKSKKP
jgi:Ca2+-binding EF-hand superfamily protein